MDKVSGGGSLTDSASSASDARTMNSEPASLAAAALCRRLRTRWRERSGLRAVNSGDGVMLFRRDECLGTWLAADRKYEFRPVGQSAPGVVAHTILGAVALTEGLIERQV